MRAAFQTRGPAAWRATLSGFCATLVGIGLARFAYTPLIPPLVTEHWFAASEAAYVGAANLAGYLMGALLARPMLRGASAATVLRLMMLAATAAFFACAAPLSFAWFFVWRFASGFAGGVLMVLGATTVLPHVRPDRRGLAAGVIFTGVGLGIAASGTLVPLLLRFGLPATWCSLGALSAALTLIAWTGWPDTAAPDGPARSRAPTLRRLLQARWLSFRAHLGPARGAHDANAPAARMLVVEYGLSAVGLVPHMVFLVDFIARGLGRGLQTGAFYWVLFGLGAVTGPVACGSAADRIGFGPALRAGLALEAAAVALPAVSTGPLALGVSSLAVGAFTPGIVALVLGRLRELVAPDSRHQQAAWGRATTAFALGQAAAAYGFSFLFATGGDYARLFALGAGALLVALAIDAAAALRIGYGPNRAASHGRRQIRPPDRRNPKETAMASTSAYSIDTSVSFDPLQRIDIDRVRREMTGNWSNRTLSRVNDCVIRLGVVQGEFHWHKHDKEDEFFYVVDGKLFIDLEDRAPVELLPNQGFTVPKGVLHRTRAPTRTTILMFEGASVVPTGDE